MDVAVEVSQPSQGDDFMQWSACMTALILESGLAGRVNAVFQWEGRDIRLYLVLGPVTYEYIDGRLVNPPDYLPQLRQFAHQVNHMLS